MMGPVENEDKKGKKLSNDALTAYALYGAAGIQLAVSVVAGLMLGNYLDKKLGTMPWITLVGIILGFAGGLLNLVKILKYKK